MPCYGNCAHCKKMTEIYWDGSYWRCNKCYSIINSTTPPGPDWGIS